MLYLVRDGLATKNIARRLDISPRTVDKHLGNVLSKLGVQSRLQAVTLVSQPIAVWPDTTEPPPD